MKNSNNKKTGTVVLIISVLLVLAGWILVFLARWVFTTWNGLRMDELIFQLKAPLEGTGDGIIMKGVLSSVIPAAVMTGLILLLYFAAAGKGLGNKVLFWSRILGLILITGSVSFAWKRLDLGEYIKNQMDESTFIEDNYVDPAQVDIEFPENKRNLVYIYLESMETTYADVRSGGNSSVHCAPAGSCCPPQLLQWAASLPSRPACRSRSTSARNFTTPGDPLIR